MSMVTTAVTTEEATRYVKMGFAAPGDLLSRKGRLVKVEKTTRQKYHYVDEDGRAWTCNHTGFEAPPVDAVWSGPAKSEVTLAKERRAALALAFGPGDIVEMKSAKDRQRFPGQYVILKATSPTRFKLQRVGSHNPMDSLTSPAGLIRKTTPGQ